MSLSVSDFNNFAAAAAAANASNPSSFAQQRSNPLDSSSARSAIVVPNSSLPQSSFNFAAFGGQYPQPASTSMTCNANFDHMAAMSASSSSNVNDVNAFAAAAAAANQQHSNNELKMMNECMMAEAASSKRPDNNNVFGLSNIQEMDVMKLFQKNALIQPGFGDMEEKMSAATKEQMQSNQLINGMKRQMVMPNSMNAALQSYHEQLAACMPPAAKRVANSNAYHMPAISQANASIAQMSMPITNGQSLMAGNGNANPHANMMHPNLMGMTSTPSNFMMANNGSSINSMAQSMAQHNMMSQQMPPVSSYPNLGALNGTMNGNNSAAAMSLQQQQQQQNFQLAAMNHQKQQNQLKAQQQMLQQQAKMHPQAAAMAQAQAAARAQAIREAQIMQQHQQRQQKLAASAMVAAPLPSSPQQGMNAQDYLTQRQLAEYTNLLRFQQAQQQQQQQANLQQQHQQQQQMAQQQLMQQHQQAALLAAAQQEQQRRKASSNPSLVPMTTPIAHSLAGGSSVTVAQSLGSQLANVMAAAARETAQQNQQKPSIAGLSNANKASYTPNASIVPMSTSSSSTATATASVIGPLKSDSAIVINGASINGSLVPAASMGHSGPDDERFQAFLASIRLQYEQQLQQQAEINKTIINVNVAASLAQTQLPKSDEIKDIEKPQENSVTKAQQIKQDAPNSPTCVDPVTI